MLQPSTARKYIMPLNEIANDFMDRYISFTIVHTRVSTKMRCFGILMVEALRWTTSTRSKSINHQLSTVDKSSKINFEHFETKNDLRQHLNGIKIPRKKRIFVHTLAHTYFVVVSCILFFVFRLFVIQIYQIPIFCLRVFTKSLHFFFIRIALLCLFSSSVAVFLQLFLFRIE